MNNYQSIFESAAEAIIIWNESTNIIKVNPSASSYLGYSCGELEAMQADHLESSEKRQQFPQRVRTLLEHGHIAYGTILLHKDKTHLQVAVSASRIVWDNQTAFCSIYHFLDESQARFCAITDSTKDAIMMMDEKGLVSLWNSAAEKIFGYADSEVMGRNLHTLLAPSRYHQAHITAFRRFQQTGEGNAIDRTLELKACHKDGHEVNIELSLSRLHMSGAWHSLGIVRDITERKRAEQKLRESEERFRVLHNASFGGIVIHDQGIIIDCNQGLSKISQYTIEELIGMNCLQLIAPDWRSIVMDKIHSGYEAPYEVEGFRKDGTTYPLSIRGSNIPYKGHEIRVAEFRDSTESKQLEDQLIQAQKMESIGTLAGGIAHDFNNILSAILGYVDLARSLTPATSPAKKSLDKALKAIKRATLLVHQILAFSRQKDTKRVPLQVAPIIKEATKLLRPMLPSTIEINQQIKEDSWSILADPTQVHQILMNLCTNACHAMEMTGGTLTVTLKNIDFTLLDVQQQPGVQPGQFVILSIGDTGPGIPFEVRKKIFDPYFTTKAVDKGTGMGLAIVHGIVKKYGGFITVDSEQGKGAWFHIYLPAVEQAESSEDVEDLMIKGDNKRILLVDDEETVADIGRAILEYLGYEVTVFTSSVEAFSVFQQDPLLFDVVITDQTMPAMTGFDLAQRMLAIRSDIPIIICTGYSNTLSEEKAQKLGVRAIAMKPFAISDLSKIIRKVIDE
ncbi:hybrid sensor histidine kinase/response regulator [Desulfogranum marinum]|uniref:hybrid sensor histidine kinase/response regulator n=1 Tax=Desulfogranum marinum TaxID=453220 RepID=UPI0019641006|nr:PAS domain S-box protein [Desulfogranum marinum]MBM9514497.1 PAS domain S-box protein [Desulfogranum marinum]